MQSRPHFIAPFCFLAVGVISCGGRLLGEEDGQILPAERPRSDIPVTPPSYGATFGEAQRCKTSDKRTVTCGGCGTRVDACVNQAWQPGQCNDSCGIAEVSLGEGHSCIRLANGSVKCWGENEHGQLGDGTQEERRTSVPVAAIAGATHVAVGEAASCARSVDGTASCWGGNSHGELGDGTKDDRSTPKRVPDLVAPAEVKPKAHHTCARSLDRTVKCWGSNAFGEVGDGSRESHVRPVPVREEVKVGGKTQVKELADVADVVLGHDHTCSLHVDHSVRCWGRGGRVGDGHDQPRPTPVRELSEVSEVVELAAGDDHTCSRHRDGSVRCWGDNAHGQLGDGTTAPRVAPTVVPGLQGVVSLALGRHHSCARFENGKASCWGRNDQGQLGDGTKTPRTSPKPVLTVESVVELRAGVSHTCARAKSGDLWCWGSNRHGQVGSSCGDSRPFPEHVRW